MVNSIVATLALFGASVAADYVGSAKVVNKCNYDVYLCNVPSSGGGYEKVDKTLSAGDSYTQQWTSLSNDNGWSIKVSKDGNNFGGHIMQYEYTFHNDGIIWYDLSCVDGNPWDQDWEITASGSECSPKQQAYRYSTDDAYGMQSCPSDNDITVTLCTGLSADNGTATGSTGTDSGSDSSSDSGSDAPSYQASSSAPAPPAYEASSSSAPAPPAYEASSSSAPAAPAYEASSSSAPAAPAYVTSSSSAPAAPAYQASTPTTFATYAAPTYGYNWNNDDVEKSKASTTFATSTTAVVTENNDNVVTVVETLVEVAYVTATAYAEKAKRHEHRPHGHAHHRA